MYFRATYPDAVCQALNYDSRARRADTHPDSGGLQHEEEWRLYNLQHKKLNKIDAVAIAWVVSLQE